MFSFQECPHCGARVVFHGWKYVLSLRGFDYGRTIARYPQRFCRWARVSLQAADFATCPACYGEVSTC